MGTVRVESGNNQVGADVPAIFEQVRGRASDEGRDHGLAAGVEAQKLELGFHLLWLAHW